MLSLAKPHQYYQVRRLKYTVFLPRLNLRITPHQVFLSQGVGMGLGMGLIFVPVVSIPSHYFKRRRALVAGIVLAGNATGAIIFPISMFK